jgi:hypothetical protein
MPTATWISLGLAAVLLVSPWVFAFPAGAATISPVVGGLLVGGAAILALLLHRRGSEFWLNYVLVNMVFGAWVFLAPLLLHFNDAYPATWVHMIIGLVVIILATSEVWRAAGKPALLKMAR